MDAIEQQRLLVRRLSELTLQAKLDWKTDGEGDPYVQFGDSFVAIKEGRSGEGATLIRIEIEDHQGDILDEFDDEDIDDQRGGPYYTMLRDMLKNSRRIAKGSNKAIDSILKHLDNL